MFDWPQRYIFGDGGSFFVGQVFGSNCTSALRLGGILAVTRDHVFDG